MIDWLVLTVVVEIGVVRVEEYYFVVVVKVEVGVRE